MTNLVRNPSNLLSLFDEFESLFSGSESRPFLQQVTRTGTLNFRPRSEENASVVEVEVPGIDPKDIKVKLEGRQLSVDTPKGNIFFSLGTRIDASEATANLKHGLLTIRIPKRNAAVVEIEVHTD